VCGVSTSACWSWRCEHRAASGEGNPLKVPKPKGVTGTKQGRKGRERNQSVTRLRKPEGAAQSGVVTRRRSLLASSNVAGRRNHMGERSFRSSAGAGLLGVVCGAGGRRASRVRWTLNTRPTTREDGQTRLRG